MKALFYRICLEQPLLATQLLGDPNSSVSLEYLPGSLLRGALIKRYIHHHRLPDDDVHADEVCWRLFFSGATRYLHAYPYTHDKERTLPTPLALFKRKHDDLDPKDPQSRYDLYNGSNAEASELERQSFEGQSFEEKDASKVLDAPFCAVDDDTVFLSTVRKQVAIHVQREREKGRATRSGGAVFQYEALGTGQWFAAYILLDRDADEIHLRELLDDTTLWLGRSRSANYGRVRLELDDKAIVVDESGRQHWREVAGTVGSIAPERRVTLTLLSDTFLRDANGHAVSTLVDQQRLIDDQGSRWIDDQILAAYIGTRVRIDPQRTFTAPIMIGGFNNAWQLPLAQATVLRAGSVITFSAQAQLDAARLRDIEWQGIGERITEGFGRVVFGWLDQLDLTAMAGRRYTPQPAPEQLSPVSQTLARRMAERLQEQQIEQAVVAYVRNNVSATGMPKNSQLGRVRVLTRRSAVDGNLDVMLRGLSAFKQASRQQFENARLGGVSLWDWLQSLARQPDTVWNTIGLGTQPAKTVLDYTAHRSDAITRQTALKLIDAVLTAPAHARREEGPQ